MIDATQPQPGKLYTTQQVAKLLGVTARTVQLWAENGLVQAWKTPGGHRRIRGEDVARLLAEVDRPDNGISGSGLGERYKLLVAEDEADLVKLYRMRVENWGFPVELVTACDGYEALIRIGTERPDMVIADLNMPRLDGFHMLKVIQEIKELRATKLVVVTALSRLDIEAKGGLPDGVHVFSKPIPFADLEQLARAGWDELAPRRAVQ